MEQHLEYISGEYSKEQFESFFDLSPDCIFKVRIEDFKFIAVNTRACDLFGYSKNEFLDMYVQQIELNKDARRMVAKAAKTYKIGQIIEVEGVGQRKDGTVFPTQVRFCKSDEYYAIAILRDVTEKKKIEILNEQLSQVLNNTERQNNLLKLNRDILKLVVQHQPLQEILEKLCLAMEHIEPIMRVSIHALGGIAHQQLFSLAAPSLPEEYIKAINGAVIGPYEGSCGSAVYWKKMIVVDDIATDDLWKNFKNLALKYDLRACWSLPIISSEDIVLGTFAIYFNKIQKPDNVHLDLVYAVADLAKIAIEQTHYQESLKSINEEYLAQNQILKQAQSVALDNESKLNDLLANIDEIVFIIDLKYVENYNNPIIYINGDTEKVSGYTNEELVADAGLWTSRIHPEDIEFVKHSGDILHDTKKPVAREYRFQHKDGHYIWIEDHICLGYSTDGQQLKLYGSARDITLRKQAETALLESKERLQLATQAAKLGSYDWLIREGKMYWDDQMCKLFGYDTNSNLDKYEYFLSILPPDEKIRFFASAEEMLTTVSDQNHFENEYRIVLNGIEKHIHSQVICFRDKNGLVYRMIGTCLDITARKQAETLLISNEEKAVLLREIHHRVKNNLQVITSLLSLQSSFFNDERQKKLFADSQYRINSMAIVHEMLYQSDNLSKLDYERYLKELSQFLIRSMKGSNSNIQLELNVSNINLGIDTAIPLGLLINEILTNSLKYGVKDEGIITIKIAPLEQNEKKNAFVLVIGDNGEGYSDEINYKTTPSLGLKLINNLVRQLEGTIEKDKTKKGTNYIIHFKEI